MYETMLFYHIGIYALDDPLMVIGLSCTFDSCHYRENPNVGSPLLSIHMEDMWGVQSLLLH